VGQEIVYCFKCQERILATDYAKGRAFQLENNSCCSGCAVLVLDTLSPKAKEQLLAKMFKATQEHQARSASSVKPAGGTSSSDGTRRIPTLPAPRPGSRPTPVAPLVLGLGAVGVVVVALLVLRSAPAESPPPETPKRPVTTVPPRDPEPASEEKRRTESARDALAKAREFARANPKDGEGQAQRWRDALLAAERTGYEQEAKRELEKCQAAARETAAQELRDLEREVQTHVDKSEFKAALDALSRRRSRPGMPEWAAAVDALEKGLQDAAERRFGELKTKAVAARDRGAPQEVAASKAEVARWGLPDYVAKFDAALEQPWRPIFDGRSLQGFGGGLENAWRVEGGVLIHDNAVNNAAVTNEAFGDGEIRIRFEAQGGDSLSFRFRLDAKGLYTVDWSTAALAAFPAGEHELLISARDDTVSATLDGKAQPVTKYGQSRSGVIQFNNRGGSLRIRSMEFRPFR
jgi:hypothetical protein